MATGRRTNKSSSKPGGSPGCLLVLAALVAVLLLFLLNLGKIRQTLISTNFNDIVRTQRGAEPQKPAPASPAARPPNGGGVAAGGAGSSVGPASSPAATPAGGAASGAAAGGSAAPAAQVPGTGPAASGSAGSTSGPAGSTPPSGQNATSRPGAGGTAQGQPTGPGQAVGIQPGGAGSEGGASQKPGTVLPPKTRAVSLYFVRIDDDGVIVRQEVKRPLTLSDSPLTDALDALLRGPTEDELRKNLISLVPQGTKLLGVQVRGSTAYINFSDAFMYNHYGIEGYAGQLKQIVYTATSFPTVQDVQILIEGELHDYLGGEGVYIGKPLSRNSF